MLDAHVGAEQKQILERVRHVRLVCVERNRLRLLVAIPKREVAAAAR